MIRAFSRIVDRELNTLVDTVHDRLEAVLEQPEIVDRSAMNLLPGLCMVDEAYSIAKPAAKIAELTQLDQQDSPTIPPRLVVGGMRVREWCDSFALNQVIGGQAASIR